MILLLLGCPSTAPSPEAPDLAVMTEGPPIRLLPGRTTRAAVLHEGDPATLWAASPERVVLAALSADEPRLPVSGALVSTAGESLGQTPLPLQVDWARGWLIARDPGSTIPTLVRLTDGASLTTELTLPDGTPAEEVRLFSGDDLLVAARGGPDGFWYGVWDGESEPTLLPLPLWPIGMSSEGGRIEAWSGSGVPGGEGECVRYQLDGEAPRCRMVDGGPAMESWSLSDRFTAVSSWSTGITLYRDSQPVPWRLEEDCRWSIAVTLADPPRVLAECHPDRDQPQRLRRLWSPDWQRAWSRDLPPDERGSFLTRPAHHPILSEPIPGISPALSERWIDLESGERWQSPQLIPLSYDGLPRPGLTRDPHTGGLVVLDFSSGVYHPLSGAGEDCPVELAEIGRESGLVLLTCRSRPNPSRFQFVHLWSVVVDLSQRRAWRLEQHPEAILGQGSVLVSDRTQSQAEGFTGFTRLEVLTLEQM